MITKIFWSKTKGARQIAEITTDAKGEVLLTYRGSVLTGPKDPHGVKCNDGFYYLKSGEDREQRAPLTEVLSLSLWCPDCLTDHPVPDVGALFEAARRGRRKITLTSRGEWEGLWAERDRAMGRHDT